MNKFKGMTLAFLLLISTSSFVTALTDEHTSCTACDANQTNSIANFKIKALELLNNRMRFRQQQENIWSISYDCPSAWFFDYFKNLLNDSSSLLGNDHAITLELTELHKQLVCYRGSNNFANNTQARYAAEDSIKNGIQKINALINQL